MNGFTGLLRGAEATKERNRIIRLIEALGCLNDKPSRYAWCGLDGKHDKRCPRGSIVEMLRKKG